MRRAVLALVALVALASTALAGAIATAGPASARHPALARIQGPAVAFQDGTEQTPRLSAFRLASSFWGGPTTAANGETVNVSVSDAYPVDPALPQSVADFLSQLDHGPELATVNVYVVTLPELQQICGRGAGGCYDPQEHRLVAPGEDLPDGTSMETILAHEYGHHVAASRFNSPWPAVDWGPKRWATAANVCARDVQGTAFPGDEGSNYLLNPGEAWAETYRLLQFQKTTWPSWSFTPWNVDESFYPTAAVLAAAREDVLRPWTRNTVSTLAGRFAAPARSATPRATKRALRPWKRTFAVPLDGTVVLNLTRAPAGTTVTLSEADGTVLAGPGRRVSASDCGPRSLVATVTAKRPGPFALVVSTP